MKNLFFATLMLGHAVFLVGCAGDKRIIFVTNTQVGARIGVDSRQIPEIVVGYNRQEAALVPIYLGGDEQGNGTFNPEYASLIEDARKRVVEAREANYDDPKWKTGGGQKNVADVQADLQQIVDDASKNKSSSLLLTKARDEAKRLAGSATAPKAADYSKLLGYIDAELRRPYAAVQFDKEAKALGYFNSKTGDRVDALSVIGTFSGSGKGKSSTASGVEAGGSIAQYFATGMAAQILAEKAGAAAINANAEPASDSEAKYAALDETLEKKQFELDELLKKALKASPTTFDGKPYTTTPSLADAIAAKQNSTVGTIRRRGGAGLDDLITQLKANTN
jgi:hypothetical protein